MRNAKFKFKYFLCVFAWAGKAGARELDLFSLSRSKCMYRCRNFASTKCRGRENGRARRGAEKFAKTFIPLSLFAGAHNSPENQIQQKKGRRAEPRFRNYTFAQLPVFLTGGNVQARISFLSTRLKIARIVLRARFGSVVSQAKSPSCLTFPKVHCKTCTTTMYKIYGRRTTSFVIPPSFSIVLIRQETLSSFFHLRSLCQ